MRNYFILLISLFFINAYAQSTIVSHDVHVLQNATQSQCMNYRGGYAGEADVEAFTSYGGFTGTSGAGVQTCSDCAIDPNSNDCVCRTCYSYFN